MQKIMLLQLLQGVFPYYHTAHVTEWCTKAVRLVARATKLHRWCL